jgi:hypothetical protein
VATSRPRRSAHDAQDSGAAREVTMTTLLICYSMTIVASHYLASFLQATLHRVFGHWPGAGKLYQTHVYSHHGIYSGENLIAEKYNDEEKSVTHYYFVPVAVLEVFAFLALPLGIFITHVVAILSSYWAHLYVHEQFHLSKTRLARFAWFKRKRKLHLLHHRDTSANFGVLSFVWDRLMGTYRDAGARA